MRCRNQRRDLYDDAAWRLVEERIHNSFGSSPGVDRVQQYVWGVRYIDDIVLHRQDNNADGDYTDAASGGGGGSPRAADATYDHLTDAQFSTAAIIDENAVVQERVTYSAYGIARHHWPPDVDGDGDADAADITIISTIASGGENEIGEDDYRAEADLNRDGEVDSTDTGIATAFGARAALRSQERRFYSHAPHAPISTARSAPSTMPSGGPANVAFVTKSAHDGSVPHWASR